MTQYLKLKNKANLCNCLGFIAPVCCRVSMWWHQVALCWTFPFGKVQPVGRHLVSLAPGMRPPLCWRSWSSFYPCCCLMKFCQSQTPSSEFQPHDQQTRNIHGIFLRQLIFEIIAVIVYLFPNPNKHPTSILRSVEIAVVSYLKGACTINWVFAPWTAWLSGLG